MASLRALIVLARAVSFSVAASAQEAPESILTAINTTNSEFVQHWNKHEPAAIAALFNRNALFVTPPGIYVGPQGLQQ